MKEDRKELFDAWVRDVGPGLQAYLSSMLKGRSDAEDLWQETFMRVHRHLPNYREEGQAKAWIFGIAKNCLRDHYRKIGREPQKVEVQNEDLRCEEEPHEELHSKELGQKLAQAIDALPEAQKEVYLLRQREGLTFKEIEGVTGEPKSRLVGRMHLALKRLSLVLEEEK